MGFRGLNGSILGSGLKPDLIRVQDPHVNVGQVKTLGGDFDLFAFTGVLVEGLELLDEAEPELRDPHERRIL